jgi:signal transduction histidine kinase
VAGAVLNSRFLPGVVAAAVVAVALAPARDRLQRAVDRFLYGERHDPIRAVTRLGQQITSAGDLDPIPGTLASVMTAVHAPGASLATPDGHVLASVGTPPGRDVVADLPPLPPQVETAAYRITTEALTNAARHANARQVRISLTAPDRSLRITVADDGRGADADAIAGVGLTSMRRRAEALGGHLDMQSGSGGTTITATLPLEPPP